MAEDKLNISVGDRVLFDARVGGSDKQDWLGKVIRIQPGKFGVYYKIMRERDHQTFTKHGDAVSLFEKKSVTDHE